jgi:dihydroorotate dehydrogenase (NAD+) catalytic subunit
MTLSYDITESYQHNYEQGPRLKEPSPLIPDTPQKEFLGLPVNSRIGIAAGLLLNSKWIDGYARQGFDILTYKTVRSSYRACYPPPNWVFIDGDDTENGPVYATKDLGNDPEKLSSAVCFGMPSMAPEIWRPDVTAAKQALGAGQVLVVSVVATPGPDDGDKALVEDFVRCATWAAEAGADVVEANFSCPNVCTGEGSIYRDAKLSGTIGKELRKALPAHPLLIKAGHFPEHAGMSDFLHAMKDYVSGITMVNGISRPVLHPDGQPVFGPDYLHAGVLGRALHGLSVSQVAQAVEIVQQNDLGLEIVGVGGVSSAADARAFRESGAAAVMLGSSPMYLPELALKIKEADPTF